MARIRTIKPEFWCSEQIAECSTNARLLFVGLWNFADDGGIHPASAKQLKMEVFPGDPFTLDQICEWVTELRNVGLLSQFTAQDKVWWGVTGWAHQKIDRPRIQYPPLQIDEASPTVRRPFGDSSTTPRSLRRDETKGDETKGDETKGDETKGGRAPTSSAAPISPDLVSWCEWWNGLHERGLVSAGVNLPPGDAIQKAHRRLARSAQLRRLLSDRDALEAAIRGSPFVNDGWFRLEKLLGGKNRDGEFIAHKLLDGAYCGKNRNGPSRISPGALYDPDRPCTPL